MEVDAPLLHTFFTRLRSELQLPLDGAQYADFLTLYAAGHGQGREGLLGLCKALWLSRPALAPRFEQLFHECFQPLASSPEPEVTPNPTPKPEPIPSSGPLPPMPPPGPEQKADRPAPNLSRAPALADIELEFGAGEGSGAESAPPAAASILETPFVFGDHLSLPFRPRYARQLWRKLRQQRYRMSSRQVDVGGTVRKLAQQGFLADLVWEETWRFAQRWVVLLDVCPGMVPFRQMREAWVDLLEQPDANSRAELLYFSSAPAQRGERFRLFRQEGLTQGVYLDTLAKAWPPGQRVLIFSDGGGASAGYDSRKTAPMLAFLKALKALQTRLAWFNPLPAAHWEGTTAALFAQAAPMFEITETGMAQAVRKALR